LAVALAKARDIGTEAVSPIDSQLSQTLFGQTTASMRPEQLSPPLISPEAAKGIVGQLPAWAGGNTPFGQGVAESTAGALSSFSAPGALAQLPAFAVPGVAETYALNVIHDLPDQGRKLLETANKYGWLSKETGQIATEYGIQDLTAFLAGKTSTAARFIKSKPRAGEVPKRAANVENLPDRQGPSSETQTISRPAQVETVADIPQASQPEITTPIVEPSITQDLGKKEAVSEPVEAQGPKELSPIKEAAIRLPDGTIFTGATHGDAWAKAGGYNGEADSGFITVSGEFLDAREALARAKGTGQVVQEDYENQRAKHGWRRGEQPTPTEMEAESFNAVRRESPSVPEPNEAGAPLIPAREETAPTSTKNAVTNAERESRNIAPAVEAGETAGTSNRIFEQTYGEEVIPGGTGANTSQLLDNARASIRTGDVDPYSILSATRRNGIANATEYAALAAEHERLVNDAVAKQKANDPSAPEAAKRAEEFANAIQPHKTAASDLMRLFQGELNYDLSTPFGMEQYMKSELGRGMKPSEKPAFEQRALRIRQSENGVAKAIDRSDVKVRRRYSKVRDIPMEEAASRVKEWMKECQV
jgi:hypothetical protein